MVESLLIYRSRSRSRWKKCPETVKNGPAPQHWPQMNIAQWSMYTSTNAGCSLLYNVHVYCVHSPSPWTKLRGLISRIELGRVEIYSSILLNRFDPIVVDPNTLNLDPDPEFWLNLNPDTDRVMSSVWFEILKNNNFREKL